MTTRAVKVVIMTLVAALLIACSREPEGSGPQFGATPSLSSQTVYKFAVHPLHNPAKLIEAYQPLVDYLNAHLQEGRLELEASRDYARFEEKYVRRDPEFLLPNPLQSLQAMELGYRVIAMAGEPADFTGIFVVRKDGGLTVPTDLKGKAVSYPSDTALAACIMPQYFLHTHGVDVNEDIDNRYVGSQESSIMNAYLGLTAAGATWPTPWRAFQKEHPEEAAQLMVIWETEPLINNSVMVRNDVPSEVADQVTELLLGLDETEEGISILSGMETARFLPATDMDYDVVRDYVTRFEAEVRQVGGF
ncbi:MAG: PhnD/SsuA/transferrin family substrate-binding protein [Gammaproteobacteria bacterium]|nr:PhnD/SsuA/transferrin family substrate-binding protein [Gammaproteobacteria bacterium]